MKASSTERRYIVASDLDEVAPNNPVWLMHTTGHYGVANHQALQLAHITAATSNPPAGTIDRDPQGVPTGVLKESAMDAVVALIPPPTPEQWRNGILRMVDTLHREGMTAVKDPDIQPPIWDAYRQLLEEKKLTVHVCVLWHGGTTLESAQAALARIQALPRPPDSLGDGNLVSCGAKFYMDGSGGAQDRLGLQGVEQELHRHRPGQLRLSLDRSRSLPSDGPPLSSGRCFCRNTCHRRSRHRLGSGYLRTGAEGKAHLRAAAQHHSCQHTDRSRHRDHGLPPEKL